MIELLVVIAIIGILASLLLPALKRARDQAKTTVCINNDKQLAVGLELYTDAYDAWFPPTSTTMSLVDQLHWAGIVRGSTDKSVVTSFICPDYDMSVYRSNYSIIANTYGYNITVVGYLRTTDMVWVYPMVRSDRIANPAKRFLIGDGIYQLPDAVNNHHVYTHISNMFEMGKYHAAGDRYLAASWAWYSHRYLSPGLFVDGHVETHLAPWPETYR